MRKIFIFFLVALIFEGCKNEPKSYGVIFSVIDTINADGTINIYAFGAKVNGIADDLPAWKAAINYASSPYAKSTKIKAPNGVSRILGQVTEGGEFYPLEKFYMPIASVTASPSVYNLYLKGVFTRTIQIVGEGNSCIYADFNDTTKLQAVFYIGAVFGEKGEPGAEQYNLEISNLGIYAQGYFKNGVRQLKVDYSQNNVIAIAAAKTSGLTLSELTIVGFKDGQVLNECYFLDENNVHFKFCKRPSYDIRSHDITYRNITAYNCDKHFEIRSNLVSIDHLYSNYCNGALWIAASDVKVSFIYAESTNPTIGQLIIGDDNTNMIENINIDHLVIGACNPPQTGILFRSNVKNVSIENARIESQFFKYNNPNTRIYTKQIKGSLPPQINYKQVVQDSTGKYITQ